MSLPVEFSPTAAREVRGLADYLEEEFGIGSRRKFEIALTKAIRHVGEFPFACPISDKRADLRKCVVTAYTIMVYRVKAEKVEIAAVFDGRRDYPYSKL